MALRIFSFLCVAMALLGILPVLLNPDMKDHVALLLFSNGMIMMGVGFGYVSRALAKLSRTAEN